MLPTRPNHSQKIISPGKLASEIHRLIPEVQARRRKGKAAQARSQISVLIYEAHRTSTVFPGGRSLSAYAAEHGLKRDAFEKYKTAGKALFQESADLFEAVLVALRDGTPSPDLPEVSKLVRLPSVRRQLVADDGTAEYTLQKTTRVRMVRTLLEEQSYGGTDDAGRRTLQALDALRVQITKGDGVLANILLNNAGVIPARLLHERAASLLQKVQAVAKMIQDIYNGTSPGGS